MYPLQWAKASRRSFTDLGCAHVVSGGQTMNPSTNDILEAVLATPAKTVMVLPNNKNIIMAAEQTVPLVKDRQGDRPSDAHHPAGAFCDAGL